MADMVGKSRGCDDKCGCPSPCDGDDSCKCTSGGSPGAMEHKQCSCGQHCGCNPCSCSKAETAGTGKAFCKCGDGCTCTTCSA